MTFLRIATVVCLFVALAADPSEAQNQTPAGPAPGVVGDPGELEAGGANGPRDIGYWRWRIDVADRQIVTLLNERAKYVSELGRLKAQAGSAVRDPAREREVLAKLTSLNGGPLPDESIVRIYEAIMAEMRLLQEQAR